MKNMGMKIYFILKTFGGSLIKTLQCVNTGGVGVLLYKSRILSPKLHCLGFFCAFFKHYLKLLQIITGLMIFTWLLLNALHYKNHLNQ